MDPDKETTEANRRENVRMMREMWARREQRPDLTDPVVLVFEAEDGLGGELAELIEYPDDEGMVITLISADVIARALEGDFEGLVVSLKGYGSVLAFLFALYPIRQLLVQGVLLGAPLALRGGRLDQGIAAERNEGMAALEAVTYLSTALAISHLL